MKWFRSRGITLLLILAVLTQTALSQYDGTPCIDDDQCEDLFNCVDGYCKHKGLWPVTLREIICYILLLVIAGPAHGLGAGSIMTPILIVGFNYDANKATMIMYSLILGGSIGAFLNAVNRKNPKSGKPVIEYDMGMIVMPVLLGGLSVGVVLKIAAPSVTVFFGLIILEVVTVKRFITQIKEANAGKPSQQPLIDPNQKIEEEEIEMTQELEEKMKKTKNWQLQQEIVNYYKKELERIKIEDMKQFPWNKIKMNLALLLWIMVMNVLRGSSSLPSLLGVPYCGTGYWFLFFLSLVGCYAFYRIGLVEVERRMEIKKIHGETSEVDFLLNPGVLPQLFRVAGIAGILAGFLGIGGGVIMGPSLLAFGCPPGTLSATLAFFVVQSSFIASFLSYWFSTNLDLSEIFFFFALACGGGFVVARVISFLVGKYQNPKITLYVMITIVGASVIVMPTYAVYKSIIDPAQMLEYRSIC